MGPIKFANHLIQIQSPRDDEEVEGLFEARSQIEVAVALKVAKKEDKSADEYRLTEIHGQLDRKNNEIQKLVAAGAVPNVDALTPLDELAEDFWNLDTEFHRALAFGAGWPVGTFIGLLRDRQRLCGPRRKAVTLRTQETVDAHARIMSAILAMPPDEVEVRNAMQDHLGSADKWRATLR